MIKGILNYAYVAEKALRREKAGLFIENGTKELVGRAEAFHEKVTLAVMDHPDSLGDSFQFILDVHNGEFLDINIVVFADLLDNVSVSGKSDCHYSKIHCLCSSLDCMLVDSPRRHHPL